MKPFKLFTARSAAESWKALQSKRGIKRPRGGGRGGAGRCTLSKKNYLSTWKGIYTMAVLSGRHNSIYTIGVLSGRQKGIYKMGVPSGRQMGMYTMGVLAGRQACSQKTLHPGINSRINLNSTPGREHLKGS